MKIKKEVISVLGINLCRECKGDWFTPIIVVKQIIGKTKEQKAWQCNNCGAIYVRSMIIPGLVTQDELNFLSNVDEENDHNVN